MPNTPKPPRATFAPAPMTKTASIIYLAAVCLGSGLLNYGGAVPLRLLGALVIGTCLGLVLGQNLRLCK